MRHDIHDQGGSHAEKHADQSSGHADKDRLDQELSQDIHAFRTDTHTEADLPRTLRHAHVHDIHDTDTTNEKRDTSHRGQQRRHYIRRTCQHRTQLLHTPDREIIIIGFPQPMVTPQYLRYLVYGLIGVLLLERRAGYALQMGNGQDLLLNSCVWS